MSDLNATDEAQTLAESYPLAWDGYGTLRLSLINQAVKAKFNSACKANAVEEFNELKPLLTEEQAAVEWRTLLNALVSGQYRWGGGQATAFLKTNPGEKALLRALLEEGGTPLSDGDISRLRSEKRAELMALYEIIMMESEAPKAKRPTTKATGAGQ